MRSIVTSLMLITSVVLICSCVRSEKNNENHFDFLHPNEEYSNFKIESSSDSIGNGDYLYFKQAGATIRLECNSFPFSVISEAWIFYNLADSDEEYLVKFIEDQTFDSFEFYGFSDSFNYEGGAIQTFIIKNKREGILFQAFLSKNADNNQFKLSVNYNYLR